MATLTLFRKKSLFLHKPLSAYGVFERLALAAIALCCLVMLGMAAGVLAYNQTESLPGSWYLILPMQQDAVLHSGQTVALVPPENPFYPAYRKFLKQIRGIPGDRVTAESLPEGGQQFFINGDAVGRAKPWSALSMELLAPGPTGTIPDNHYFVWTPHVDSYDSRYADIGWVDRSAIVARAYRLF